MMDINKEEIYCRNEELSYQFGNAIVFMMDYRLSFAESNVDTEGLD